MWPLPSHPKYPTRMPCRIGPDALIDDVADGRGAHEETVVVVVKSRVVFVEGADEFRGVAGEEKVLQIDIAEQ